MLDRETRAPAPASADKVCGLPTDEPPTSYDDYTYDVEEWMRTTYAIVRGQLGRAVERMKQQYDLRVRPQKFQRGERVLHYNPRKIQGRQQKR